MSKKQQLYNLVMGAYAGLPEAASVAAHHMNAVSEKNALKHWQAHGGGIQAAAQNRRNQLRMQQMQQQMQQAAAAARSQAAPAKAQTKQLVSTLKAANAGPRGARSKTQKRAQQSGVRNTNVLQASGYLGGTGDSSLQAKPIGASINMA
jgi:hypothetical protein|tara:strand:- start:2887 stop:3333 length:447 start_codon:yes stop_codon:yes gene_type:complete